MNLGQVFNKRSPFTLWFNCYQTFLISRINKNKYETLRGILCEWEFVWSLLKFPSGEKFLDVVRFLKAFLLTHAKPIICSVKSCSQPVFDQKPITHDNISHLSTWTKWTNEQWTMNNEQWKISFLLFTSHVIHLHVYCFARKMQINSNKMNKWTMKY